MAQLTRKQSAAILALLSQKSVAAAAAVSTIPERTLYRFLQDDNFRRELAAAESAAIGEASRRLLAGQAVALDALETIIKTATKDSDKRQAAVNWLDYVLRYREQLDTEERVSALELAVFGGERDKA